MNYQWDKIEGKSARLDLKMKHGVFCGCMFSMSCERERSGAAANWLIAILF